MPGGTRSILGNLLFSQALYLPSVAYPTIAGGGSGASTLTVIGVLPGDLLQFNLQSPPAHLSIDNAYVSAVNTISVLWGTDSTGVTGGTTATLLQVSRPENESLGIASLPSLLTS